MEDFEFYMEELELLKAIELLRKGRERKDDIRDIMVLIVGKMFQRVKIEEEEGLRINSLDATPPFVGLINKSNPSSGSYGGMSLVFFPCENQLLMCFGIGTAGISPDEKILTNNGHIRRLMAIRELFPRLWVKERPADLSKGVPRELKKDLNIFDEVFRKYDNFLYSVYPIDDTCDEKENARVFLHHLVLYSVERGWQPKKSFEKLVYEIQGEWIEILFRNPTEEKIYEILTKRHYVILQGPPGTGKTFLAEKIGQNKFPNRFAKIQFHPHTTYESFVRGIRPQTMGEGLAFKVARGILDRVGNAQEPFLLIIDEFNRADLAKVLGEAIYLLEPQEINKIKVRTVESPYPEDGNFNTEDPAKYQVKVTQNLFILGTMNTSDRSIAILDFAIRRRFAFVNLWPDRTVVEKENPSGVKERALKMYDKILSIFIEYADEEEFNLIPGHFYFIAQDDRELRMRFEYELKPLLQEYLAEGYFASFRGEILFVLNSMLANVK